MTDAGCSFSFGGRNSHRVLRNNRKYSVETTKFSLLSFFFFSEEYLFGSSLCPFRMKPTPLTWKIPNFIQKLQNSLFCPQTPESGKTIETNQILHFRGHFCFYSLSFRYFGGGVTRNGNHVVFGYFRDFPRRGVPSPSKGK